MEAGDGAVSVLDYEAFAAKHLPDLGHDVKDFQVYTWRLTNWMKLEKRITSPEFDCGGHKWRILLFPFGNSSDPSRVVVSVYLDYAGPKESSEGRHACARFALVISNIHDPTIFTVSQSDHRFTAEECDWGFTCFCDQCTLFNIQEGHFRPTIEENSADITVYIRVLKDPAPVLWPEEERLFLTARVITDDTFARHQGFDLATFGEKKWPQSDPSTFRVPKQETYGAFKSRVAARFELPDNKVRLWALTNRANKTVRPDTPIPENDPSLTVEAIRDMANPMRKGDLCLYFDVITGPSRRYPPPGHIMVFLKHFDTSKQTLLGVGKVFVSRNSKVQDLHLIIVERMKWTPDVLLRLYEEIKPGMIELMKPESTFAENEIGDGDVICFQVEQEEKEFRDLEIQGLYSNPVHFYGFLQNRVMIFFRPKLKEPDNDHPEFSLVLSKKHKYDTMAQRAGEYLRHDPIKLRFTTTHVASAVPKGVLKRSLDQSIADFTDSSHVNPTTTVILYEKLDVNIA
ncbi:ICP0-binding domain of ubiquitin-specific protease 7-domain-containing protein [Pisolithus croceorrhizus]|nr:ICP0-binding domain of ubiquitin-specific protease 7-domain-containing protein [Pisolithus croceorrhizus]